MDRRQAMSGIRHYYDQLSPRQVDAGVNLRHRSISSWMRQFGVGASDSVLEIGCGVGTQSELIAKLVTKGPIRACDQDDQFDVIVLPDVLEHIPQRDHASLFQKLSSWLAPHGKVIIHTPEPFFLEWQIKTAPHSLQIIDQPVHTSVLARNATAAGLYIHFLSSYSIWKNQPDYQIALLKPQPQSYTDANQSQLLRRHPVRFVKVRARRALDFIRR
jgi:trans-aconitate 2-methyltransferase